MVGHSAVTNKKGFWRCTSMNHDSTTKAMDYVLE